MKRKHKETEKKYKHLLGEINIIWNRGLEVKRLVSSSFHLQVMCLVLEEVFVLSSMEDRYQPKYLLTQLTYWALKLSIVYVLLGRKYANKCSVCHYSDYKHQHALCTKSCLSMCICT